jgi:AraC-like DNA-binding protein
MRPHPSFYPTLTPSDQAAITIVSVGRSDMLPEHRLRRERWKAHQFMFTLSGAGVGEVAGQPFAVGPGDVALMPKDREHRYQVRPGDSGWTYLWVEYDGACVPALFAMLGLAGRVAVAGCAPAGEFVERIFTHLHERGDAALHEAVAIFLQGLAVIERCARAPASADRRGPVVDRVKQHMADHLGEPISLADLAGVAGLSPFHLTRLFRAEAELPPMRYLRRLRANRAQALLHRRELKAAEVGRAVGYPTLQHFSRMFKQETGMTLRRFVREVVRR